MDPLEGLDLSALTGTNNSGLGTPSFEVREGEEEAPAAGEGITQPTGEGEGVEGGTGEESSFEPTVNQIGLRDGEGNVVSEGNEDDNFGDEDEEPSIISSFTEMGLIDLEEGELENEEVEKDLAWFAEKARAKAEKEIESGIESYKDSLPDEIRDLLENYEAGVPIGALIQGEKEIFDIASISEERLTESEQLQKNMIAEMLNLQGESPEDIKDMLLDYEESGLLEKNAKRAHKKLVQYKAAEQARLIESKKAEESQRRESYQTWLSTLKEDITSREEIIPGVALTDKQKTELYNGITKVDKKGQNAVMKYRAENPDFDLQVAYLATVLKGDFSALERAATTKATKDLKDKASSGSGSSSTKRGRSLKGVDLNIMKKFA